MIGNPGYATYIRDWYVEEYAKPWGQREDCPEGWRLLGGGLFRKAFLSPDGVVYKVQHNYKYSGQTNEGEWETFKRMRLECRMPKGVRLPRMYYHALDGRGVIAMEKMGRLLREFSVYSEEGSSLWTRRAELCEITGMWDLHGENLALDETTSELVIIDWGES